MLLGGLLPFLSYGDATTVEKSNIAEAIKQGRLLQLAESAQQEFQKINELLQQLSQQAEYNVDGQLSKLLLSDGTVEHYTYHEQQLVSVSVMTKDNQLLEERTYRQGRLRSVIQADGTMLSINYPRANRNNRLSFACQISIYDDQPVRLLNYDQSGTLYQAYDQFGQSLALGPLAAVRQRQVLIKNRKFMLGVVEP